MKYRARFRWLVLILLFGLVLFSSLYVPQTSLANLQSLSKQGNANKIYTPIRSNHGLVLSRINGQITCRDATEKENISLLKRDPNREFRAVDSSNAAATGLKIVLRFSTAYDTEPDMKATVMRAASTLESLIATPITVVIDIDLFSDIQGLNITYGVTDSQDLRFPSIYPTVRANLIAGASTSNESALYNLLPESSLPTDRGDWEDIKAPSALFRALGILNPVADPSVESNLGPPPLVRFNNCVLCLYDFDPSDGIGSVKVDFYSVALHELGHALGLTSNAGQDSSSPPSVWDIFRFRPGTTQADFSTAQRILSAGGQQVFFFGSDFPLSTGVVGGDGRQASHWKDDELGQIYYGMMDPSPELGTVYPLTNIDILALDAIGYRLKFPPMNAHLFFDGSSDPRFIGAIFSEPLIDSQGRLIVSSTHFSNVCGFNICGSRLNSISPVGTLNWQTPNTGGYIDPRGGLRALGPGDRAYVDGYDTAIYAFDSTGMAVPGWPISVLPSGGNSSFADFNPIIVNDLDGTVYLKAGVFFSFSGFPSTILALKPDGSQKWRKDYPNGSRNYGIARGPFNDIYTVIDDQFVGIFHLDGAQFCSQTTLAFGSAVVGGAEGVFTSFRDGIRSFDVSCNTQLIYSSAREVILQNYDHGIIFALDYPINPFDPSLARLFAVSSIGSFLWRNQDILVSTSGNPIHAIKNGVLYVIGQHVTDGNKQKLFLVNEFTGQILNAVETTSYCQSCGVAVSNNGIIYLNDRNSTRIYKLVATDCTASISPTQQFLRASGGDGSVSVAAPPGCSWAATSNVNWVALTSANNGNGSGVVTFEVRENFTGNPRIGTLTIAGQTLTITQDGDISENCSFAISPTGRGFNPMGGVGTVDIATGSGCDWIATSNVGWIILTSSNNGTGSGGIIFSVAANHRRPGSLMPAPTRKGTITIAGQIFSVKQQGD